VSDNVTSSRGIRTAAADAADDKAASWAQQVDCSIVACSSNGEFDVIGVQPVRAAASAAHQVPSEMSQVEAAAAGTVLEDQEASAQCCQWSTGVCLPDEVFSSPIAVDDRVLLGCRDNHLYCLKLHRRG
jgi:hypothetical protein